MTFPKKAENYFIFEKKPKNNRKFPVLIVTDRQTIFIKSLINLNIIEMVKLFKSG